MTDQEYRQQQARIIGFYARLPQYFMEDVRTFSGVIASSKEPVSYKEREKLNYSAISENIFWGELWDSAWIRLDGEFPTEWKDKEILLKLNVGGEGLLFDADGVPFYSITNTSSLVKHYRKEYVQFGKCHSSGKFSIWLEAAVNGLFGDEINPECGQVGEFGTVRTIRYGLFRRDVWELALDFDIIMGLLHFPKTNSDFAIAETPAFPLGGAREKQLMRIAARAVDCFAGDPANTAKARAILAEALSIRAADSAMQVTAVGHAHIDTGWLWPVRESVRKSARTFASQITLMERYPDYVFGASQPQHYLFIKENYPELYEKIRERVAEGRWELQGGMWVECDCNLANGESIIRQFLHGKNFFRNEFGKEVRNLWLPDVFGYSAALPQIIRKTGCDFFLTQKLSWNQVNKFPHHCFNWVGLDGTRVLSFFPPEDNYNSTLYPEMLNYGVNNFSENDYIPEIISLFGIGDGGGGPKEEYIERGIRCADLDGVPRVRFGRADEFLKRLEKYSSELPAWHGELYFEAHRGTLTTHAEVKRNNRRCEELLNAIEKLCIGADFGKYPAKELDRLWKLLLLNQFHDILPGSSIALVYDRTRKEHKDILDSCQKILDDLFPATTDDTVTFVNTLGVPYSGFTALPDGWRAAKEYPAQKGTDGKYYVSLQIPPHDKLVLHKEDAEGVESANSGRVLENKFIRAEFSAEGNLISLYDKNSGREFITGECGFRLYHDHPNYCDAWEIDSCYEKENIPDAVRCTGISETKNGALWSEITIQFAIGNSTAAQNIRLAHDAPYLTFNSTVDWKENHKLLRVDFPTSLHNGTARYDIQYGFIERPIHRNTSWDEARFEVCMHKFLDLADYKSGLALLNDCKYGASVHENIIGMTLLRAPEYPDSTADRGTHEFCYVLYPHSGDFRDTDVQSTAFSLNRAPLMLSGDASWELPVRLENVSGNVVLEVVKRAENEDAIVIRCVERHGRSAVSRIHFSAPWKTLEECDMMEWNSIGSVNNGDEVEFTPFEIKTFILRK